ncbi:chorismate synthase [Sporolactobacillus sp. CPB3-1]|uniref:Chorismate synthase n=1 Tax=Sporolactobacillus mangiferae TaxID=2940498 RepID=A0ABT0MC37_9BACL|nr:chorismate synthase [Sporolactobacillus mangiferae]MCL1631900.1 chorismate synthase [Sporolactobacillus mangiferae]
MSSSWGRQIKLTVFGESHGPAIGGVVDGLPPGLAVDFDQINQEMQRRVPGRHQWSSRRHETDTYEVLSGLFHDKTTGTPLSFLIRNHDAKSKDYTELLNVPRPGHADYTGAARYHGYQDYRGGGHFSGRLTAPIVFAGSIARQLLALKDIQIGAHIRSIGSISDQLFDPIHPAADLFHDLAKKQFPVISDACGNRMQQLIESARKDCDSVGGIIEAAAVSVPAGVGSPIFDALESILSSILFAIPAIKGVSFGDGFGISRLRGSEANDPYDKIADHDGIVTTSNHNGGILGGITNGMPILFQVAVKPTASIAKKQRSVNLMTGKTTDLIVKGRHDPCIVPRAVPVVEAAAAFALLDVITQIKGLEYWL